jgi:UDP-N-acetylenolpyruvoylglucosamine reductase
MELFEPVNMIQSSQMRITSFGDANNIVRRVPERCGLILSRSEMDDTEISTQTHIKANLNVQKSYSFIKTLPVI